MPRAFVGFAASRRSASSSSRRLRQCRASSARQRGLANSGASGAPDARPRARLLTDDVADARSGLLEGPLRFTPLIGASRGYRFEGVLTIGGLLGRRGGWRPRTEPKQITRACGASPRSSYPRRDCTAGFEVRRPCCATRARVLPFLRAILSRSVRPVRGATCGHRQSASTDSSSKATTCRESGTQRNPVRLLWSMRFHRSTYHQAAN